MENIKIDRRKNKKAWNFKDLTGQVFGKQTVVRFSHVDENKQSCWIVACSCGSAEHIVTTNSLKTGNSKSCGCTKRERMLAYNASRIYGHAPNFDDLTNKLFTRLTAIKYVSVNDRGEALWLCKCSCEKQTEIIVRHDSLIYGNTKSCGCIREEHPNSTTHGMDGTPLHIVWLGMKQRCYNPKSCAYSSYGGRGIKMCDRWLGKNGFLHFYEDKGSEYERRTANGEKISIDRFPNVNGDYEPDNTRWATNSQQMRNTRESAITEDYDEHKKQRLVLSRYLNSAIKFDKGSKLFFTRFGISLIDFRKYIESQFTEGMTWDNHGLGMGTWQFDHIVGCNNFDLSKKEDRLKCFHYTNLSPMWDEDHMKKDTKRLISI